MANEDIKRLAKQKRLAQWEIADALGMSEQKYCRKLRRELSDGEKAVIIIAMETAVKSRENDALEALGLKRKTLESLSREELINYILEYGRD